MTEQKTVNNSPMERMTPSGDLQLIVPSDTTEFENFTRAIILGSGDGSLSAVDAQGKDIDLPVGFLLSGFVYPFQLQKINDTGTGTNAVLVLF